MKGNEYILISLINLFTQCAEGDAQQAIRESVTLAMNVPPDTCHTKANTEFDEKEETTHSFSITWIYVKYCTRKTVYEKVFFPSHLIF